MAEWDDFCLAIKEQTVLLSLNRTGLYRKAQEPSELVVKIKHLIDRNYTKHPFKGARRIRNDINAMKLR